MLLLLQNFLFTKQLHSFSIFNNSYHVIWNRIWVWVFGSGHAKVGPLQGKNILFLNIWFILCTRTVGLMISMQKTKYRNGPLRHILAYISSWGGRFELSFFALKLCALAFAYCKLFLLYKGPSPTLACPKQVFFSLKTPSLLDFQFPNRPINHYQMD